MTTIEKPTLPRRKPKGTSAPRPATAPQVLVIHFSFNRTTDPDWTPDPGTEPISRRERRIARTAAANTRARSTSD